jgi:pilus assembly protein CpaB
MAERRYTTIFAAAIVTAAAATFGIYRVLQVTKAEAKITTQPVVVAMEDIPEGKSIDRTSVRIAQWVSGTAPAGAFSSIDSVVGRVTRVDVFKGEVVVPGRLAPNGTGPGLQVKITPGKRAASVRIDDVAGIGGLIQPNSRVDVMVAIRDEKKNEQVAKLFMSNMRVLSVGTQDSRTQDNRPIAATTVTLEVTPVEAERLMIAQGEGRIQLVLRGYGDPDSIKTEGAKSADVLAQLRSAPTYKPEPEKKTTGAGNAPRKQAAPVQQSQVAPAPIVQAPSAPVVEQPKRPDSLTVQIFKAGKEEQRKFQKDSAKKPPF